jgi:hypothetical protein
VRRAHGQPGPSKESSWNVSGAARTLGMERTNLHKGVGAGGEDYRQHDLSLGDRYIKPSISDLERLARFFGVPITIFFPHAHQKSRTNAVLTGTGLYAQFRRARAGWRD